MNNKYVVILAAGKGTRMKSKLYKVLHEVCGKSMVDHVVTQVEKLNPTEIVTVVGHGAQQVEDKLGTRSKFVKQVEQLGTGHAVQQAESILGGKTGSTLVINGDTPLFTAKSLAELFEAHEASGAKVTVLSALAPDPTGYGRIIRDEEGNVLKIVEQKDATQAERAVQEINSGVYCFDNEALFASLKKVTNDNAQGEFYLTDVMEILRNEGEVVGAYQIADFDESMGVNDRVALAKANQIMQARINHQHMVNGVTLVDPANTYIGVDVEIGNDTIIEPNVTLIGKTKIGSDTKILSGSRIVNSEIGNNVCVESSTIEDSIMHDNTDIGPNSHLRPQSEIMPGAHLGNFVEIKKAVIGENTKVGHLTYVGDATLGSDINVGCGVVFVNYDGIKKHHANIGDHSFIGSNSNIVAPITVSDHSFIAAGSTITKDVPYHALAIARGRQENKPDFWDRLPIANDPAWNNDNNMN